MNKSVAQKILEIENSNDLFSVNYKGVPLWELARYDVFLLLSQKNDQNIELKKKERKNIKFLFFSNILNILIFNNPLFFLRKNKIMLIRASRKVKFNDAFIDPYTDYFEKLYINSNLEVWESSFSYQNKSKFAPNILVVDYLSNLLYYFISFLLKKKLNNIIREETEKIAKHFPEIDLNKIIVKSYILFKLKINFYKKLFKIKTPRQIILTNYISKKELIFVAKINKIKVIEVQHGFTSPNLMLYHFPFVKKDSLKTFPDEFYYLDTLYKYKVELPIAERNIFKYEGDLFQKKRNSLIKFEIEEYSVLFVSQHVLFETFLKFVENFCIINQQINFKYKVYYKPHPNEYELMDFEYLNNLQNKYNIIIIGRDSDIYKYIATIRTVVGVYSTVLLEAVSYGSNVYVLNIDGVDYFECIIRDNIVSLINTPEELINKLSIR